MISLIATASLRDYGRNYCSHKHPNSTETNKKATYAASRIC